HQHYHGLDGPAVRKVSPMSQVFSGSPDVAYCSGIPVTHPPVTLAAWVKPSNPPTSGRQTVLSVGYDAGTGLDGNGYRFGLTGNGSGVGYDKAYTVNQAGLKYYKNLNCGNDDYYITWNPDTQNGTAWNVYMPLPDAPGGTQGGALPCSTVKADWDSNYVSAWDG